MKKILNKIRFVFAKKVYYVILSQHYILGNKLIGVFTEIEKVKEIQNHFTIHSDSKCLVFKCNDLNKILVRLDNV